MHLSKKKILIFNDNLFMTKSQREAIIHRSKLNAIYNETKDWDK